MTFLALLVAQVPAVSQVGGRKGAPSAPATPASKARKPKPKTNPKPNASPRSKRSASGPGTIELIISESDSEVFITTMAGLALFDGEPQISPGAGTPLLAEDLDAGAYTLVIRKPNFFEERRHVTVYAGKAAKVTVILRPSTAFLTVTANVDNPEIEIKGIGVFKERLSRSPVKPGTYEITVRRHGYIDETKQVILPEPGLETSLSFTLRPIPVAEMLAAAERHLAQRDPEKAVALVSEVLTLDPAHTKANLIKGRGLYMMGSSEATNYLLRAVQNGEFVTIKVRVYTKSKAVGVIAGDLTFDRSVMSFLSNTRPDLNFAISKSQISEMTRKVDERNISYISFRGKGSFDGRKAERKVVVYSEVVALKGNETFCPSPAGGVLKCDSDAANIFALIAGWQSQN